MKDQLKAFLDSLMYVLMLIRIEGNKTYDWSIDARAQVFLACTLGIITPAQKERLLALSGEARLHSGKPFPSEKNAGPCITWFELHKRQQAFEPEPRPSWLRGGLEALEMVRADMADADPVAATSESKPKEGWGSPALARKAHYFVDGQSICNRWIFTGALYERPLHRAGNCSSCVRLLAVKPQAQDSANEKPEPVPAPTSRRQLRLLCVLGQAGGAQGAQPVATLQPMPPRPRIHGQWPPACRAPLVLRDTQARCPTAQVLARCLRHRQANAFRPAT